MDWTPRQRLTIHPTRRAAPIESQPWDAASTRDLPEALSGFAETSAWMWNNGLSHASDEAVAPMRAALALCAGDEMEVVAETELALLTMLDYHSRRGLTERSRAPGNERYAPVDRWFLARWLEHGGVPFVLDLLAQLGLRTSAVKSAPRPDHAVWVTRREAPSWPALENGHLGALYGLRGAVVGLSDDDYAIARDAAARTRAGAPSWLRAGVSFCFPDEEAFAREDYEQSVAETKKGKRLPSWTWGLATTCLCADVEATERILDSMARDPDVGTSGSEHYGATLVHLLGDDAAPLLIGYLAVVRNAWAKECFARALTVTKGPETRAWFTERAKDKKLGKLAAEYLAG